MASKSARGLLVAVAMLAIGLSHLTPARAQARPERIVTVSPWTATLDPNNPRTPEYGCLPEAIYLAGEIRSQVTKVTDARGVVHYTHQLIPNHVVGYGLRSGARYRAVGTHYHSGEVLHGGPEPKPPFHLAEMQNFYVIGQVQATDFMLHLLVRITVNANGQGRGFVEQFRVECR
jgi:hypothetical protein